MSALLLGMNHAAAAGLAGLLNTLWYAGAVVALAWVGLRRLPRVNAATRYWIWTAVLGFLLVVPLLPVLVKQARTAPATREEAAVAVAPLAKVPAPVSVRETAPITLTVNDAPGSNPWPLWLLAVWAFAAAWQLVRLMKGVALVRRLKVCAEVAPLDAMSASLLVQLGVGRPRKCGGPNLDSRFRGNDGTFVLRGLAKRDGRAGRQAQLLTSAGLASPVAVGYIRPAVIVPPDLLARLEDDEKRDVLLHELAHLARYDDWMALATHALGALLILHPLAAIVMRQIEREREMACDDFVVAQTGAARSYARSLARLHDLRWNIGTRLLAAGLLGRNSSLGDRIELLLRRGRKFSTRPSLASLSVSALLLVLLLGAGSLMPGWIAIAQTTATLPTSFEVASIRPDNPSGNRHAVARIVDRPNDGRFYATEVTAKMLIQDAYGVQEDSQIEGGPSWIDSERFDVQAKADEPVSDALRTLRPNQAKLVKQRMLQALLADRFKLTVVHDTKELKVYDLVVAKNGPKLREVNKTGTAGGPAHSLVPMRHFQPAEGEQYLSSYNGSMPGLAEILSHMVGRMVVDKTGLTGRYDFTLHWTPEFGRVRMGVGFSSVSGAEAGVNGLSEGAPASASSGPSIFTAIQQQLGLKLKPAKGRVEVLVVDHVEPPTPN